MSQTNYEEQMNHIYPTLSQSERLVAEYMDKNMSNVLRMTTKELREAIGVSEPTIFRFCRAMGYTGIRDFKISMAEQISSYKEYFFHAEQDEGDGNKLNSLISRTLSEESRVIDNTLRFMDYGLLEKAAQMFLEAKKICLFGVGTSHDVCVDIQRKLTRLGLSAWAYNDFHNAMMLISTLKHEDVVFCISHSGLTPETKKVIKIASEKSVPTLLMTSFPTTPMCSYADLILRTHSQEISTQRTAMSSRISQYALFDAVYMTLVYLMGEEVVGLMEQTVQDTYHRK